MNSEFPQYSELITFKQNNIFAQNNNAVDNFFVKPAIRTRKKYQETDQ